MNLLLAHASELKLVEGEQRLVVEGRRAHHVHKVLRATLGQRIRIGVVCESIGSGEIVELEQQRVVLGALQLASAGPAPRVKLVIALPRPKAPKRLLETAASFGVAHIDLVNAWRVDKSYWSSPSVELEAMQHSLQLGCEQGRHVWMPTISTQRFLMPFLESKQSTAEHRLLAHPGAERWLEQEDAKASCVIAIGPEGGWIEDEVTSFEAAGYQRFALSGSILRSEIAVAAALAQLERAAFVSS